MFGWIQSEASGLAPLATGCVCVQATGLRNNSRYREQGDVLKNKRQDAQLLKLSAVKRLGGKEMQKLQDHILQWKHRK